MLVLGICFLAFTTHIYTYTNTCQLIMTIIWSCSFTLTWHSRNNCFCVPEFSARLSVACTRRYVWSFFPFFSLFLSLFPYSIQSPCLLRALPNNMQQPSRFWFAKQLKQFQHPHKKQLPLECFSLVSALSTFPMFRSLSVCTRYCCMSFTVCIELCGSVSSFSFNLTG